MAAAMLSVFSLLLMALGSLCIAMALSKQSVLALLSSDPSVPVHHRLSWSVSCLCCSGVVLLAGGFLFLLLALPYNTWHRCLPQGGGD
ncbi:hypothetical protein NHX12_024324 [Muraenolepis orangiensis]|uniref:NADH dehydrogenase subunit 6 n=1 Tax=Muraenolepis orangiensis TaxID=630683 RepID=A0A9Q0EM56_9TELE|nr:hypothetical protein NHX12_024324 [Muraenolepis orangiensis]